MQWWNSVPFDSEKWKHGPDHDRFDMVYELQKHYDLVGRSRKDIEELLGTPSHIERQSEQHGLPRFSSGFPRSETEHWYWIGHEKYVFAGMDSAFLVIGFKGDNAVNVYIGGG